jgi:ABC-type nitrate/sulfonate/bicarbonate transport system substrate-binding protein
VKADRAHRIPYLARWSLPQENIRMQLQLGLEWFLNPDHLPMIAGIELGWYREAGL